MKAIDLETDCASVGTLVAPIKARGRGTSRWRVLVPATVNADLGLTRAPARD